MYWLRGYRQNHVRFTNVLTVADDLSKYGSFCWICVSLPLRPFVPMGISSTGCDIGNSTISNQLVAGSIIVTHIKSITVPSCPFRVYGPIRSTHKSSQGFVITRGNLPYLCLWHLLTWHFLQVLTYDWMVHLIPFQYIAIPRVSSRQVDPGCCR